MYDLEDEVETIIMGYSLYIPDTNIPKNHQACLSDPNKDPTGYLKYTSLAEYLRKVINFMRRRVPKNEFLKDEETLAEISGGGGVGVKKVCRRIQQGKDNSFDQETNIGIYLTARHGNLNFTPRWNNLMNYEEICKMMMKANLDGDVYNMLTKIRLLMLLTRHSVGRVSDGKYLNINNFKYNIVCECLDTLWIEMKTIMKYSCTFVPNKRGHATFILHNFGCYFDCGKGMFHTPNKDGKINPYLIPHIAGMVSSNVLGWFTKAIQRHFPY